MNASDRFVTIRELAEMHGVERTTAWRWVNGGLLPSEQIGGILLIPRVVAKKFTPPPVGNPLFLSKKTNPGCRKSRRGKKKNRKKT